MENNRYNKSYGFYFNGNNALIGTKDLNVIGLTSNEGELVTNTTSYGIASTVNLNKNTAISFWFAFDNISGFTSSQQCLYSTTARNNVGTRDIRIFKSGGTNNIYAYAALGASTKIALIASAITSNTLYHIMWNINNTDNGSNKSSIYFNGKEVYDTDFKNIAANNPDGSLYIGESKFNIFGAFYNNSQIGNSATNSYLHALILPVSFGNPPTDYFYGYMFDFTFVRNFQTNTFKNNLEYSKYSKLILDYLYNDGYGCNKTFNIVNANKITSDSNFPFIPQYNSIDFLNLKKYGSISTLANYIGPDALENGVSTTFQPVFKNSQTLTNTLINNMEKSFPYRIGNKLFPVKTNYPYLSSSLPSSEIFFNNKKISLYQDLLGIGNTNFSYSGALTNNSYLYFNVARLSSLNITNSKLRAISIINNRVPYDLTLPINTNMVLFNLVGDNTNKLSGLTLNVGNDIFNLNKNATYISRMNIVNNGNLMSGNTVNSGLGYITSSSNLFEKNVMTGMTVDTLLFNNNGYIHYNNTGRTDLFVGAGVNNPYYPNLVEMYLPSYFSSNATSIATNRLRYRSPRYYPNGINDSNNFSSITSNMGHTDSVVLKLVTPVTPSMFTYSPQTQINATYSAGTALVHALYNSYTPSATTNYKNLNADFSNSGLSDYLLASEDFVTPNTFSVSPGAIYIRYGIPPNTFNINNNSGITYTTLNLSNNNIWNDIFNYNNNDFIQYGLLTDNNNRINFLLANIGDKIQYGQINLNNNKLNGYFNNSNWNTIPNYSLGEIPTKLNIPWTGRTNITRLDLSNNNINMLGYYPQCVEFNITGNTTLSGDCGISIPNTMRTLRIGGTKSNGDLFTRANDVAFALTSITQSGNFNNVNTLGLNYCGLINNGVSNTYSGNVFLLNDRSIIANSANTITLSNTVASETAPQLNCGQFSNIQFINSGDGSVQSNQYTYGNIIDLSQSVIKNFNNIIAVGSGIARFIFPTASSINFNGIFDLSYNYVLNDSNNDRIQGKSGFTIPSNVTFTSGSSFIIQSNNRTYAYGSTSSNNNNGEPIGITTTFNARFNNMPIGTRILSNNINLRNNNFSSDTYNTIINNLYINRLNFSTAAKTLLIDRQYSNNNYSYTGGTTGTSTSLVFTEISKSLAQTYDLRNQPNNYNWVITDDYGTGATPYYRLVNSAITTNDINNDIIANFNINPTIYGEISARTFTILDGGSQQIGTPLSNINGLNFSFISRGTDTAATNNGVGATYYRLRTTGVTLSLLNQTITGFTFSIN